MRKGAQRFVRGTEHLGLVVFFEPDDSISGGDILLRRTTPLWTFSIKRQQKWNRMALFYITPESNATFVSQSLVDHV
jgi:hypothetical protein